MRRRATASPRYALLTLSGAPHDTTASDGSPHAGPALGSAIAVHAIVLLVVAGLARVQPPAPPGAGIVPSSIERFIFTSGAAEAGGRSAGGSRSRTTALARSPGADAHAVAAAATRNLTAPDTIERERELLPALPVVAMNAGDLLRVGALDGVPGPPSDERGPGDAGTGSQPGSNPGLGHVRGSGIGDGAYPIGNGVSAPTVIHRTQPQYSADAMRAKLQGVAVLAGVVGIDGMLHDIRVTRSLDAVFGLDQEAIKCVRQWRFRPGTRQGTPVPVSVTIEVAFNLR